MVGIAQLKSATPQLRNLRTTLLVAELRIGNRAPKVAELRVAETKKKNKAQPLPGPPPPPPPLAAADSARCDKLADACAQAAATKRASRAAGPRAKPRAKRLSRVLKAGVRCAED